MIYRFLILSDEVDQFAREVKINSDATFLEFNNAILDSVKYTKDQITSFFICNDNWQKQEEISLIEMDTNSETDSYLMENTPLDEFITDEGQRLLYIFDNITDRAFFIELEEIQSGFLDAAQCTLSKGNAPSQTAEDDIFMAAATVTKGDIDSEFYGDSDFDLDELDSEGFGDMSIDELGETY